MRRPLSRIGLIVPLILAVIAAGPSASQPGAGGDFDAAEVSTDALKLDLSNLSAGQKRIMIENLGSAGALVKQAGSDEIIVDRTPAIDIIRQLRQRGAITSASVAAMRAELLMRPDALLRLNEVQQTHEPRSSAQILIREHQLALNQCNGLSGTRKIQCRQRVDLEYRELLDAAGRMSAADPRGDCGAAAKIYGATVRQCADGSCPDLQHRLETEGAAVDRACLATLDSLPAGASAHLQYIAIIEAELNGVYKPICGGLFISSRKVVTAHHCFEPDEYRRQVAAGKVRTRVANGLPGQSWKVTPFDATAIADLSRPRLASSDYFTFSTEGGPSIAAAPSLNPTEEVTEAIVIGHFRHFDRSRVPAASSAVAAIAATPEWQAGLRFSKPGTCWVVGREDLCLRLYCQTIPGFSGTPIFQAGNSGGGKLMGLISRRADEGDRCRAPGTLQGLTIGAIPPAAVLQVHASRAGRTISQARGTSR